MNGDAAREELACPLCGTDRTDECATVRASNARLIAAGKSTIILPTCPRCGAYEAPRRPRGAA